MSEMIGEHEESGARLAPWAAGRGMLMLLSRRGATVRDWWLNQLSEQGFAVVAPDLSAWHTDAGDDATLARRILDMFVAAGTTPVAVLALQEFASVALAMARSGRIEGGVAFAGAGSTLLSDGPPVACPFALHMSLMPGMDVDAVRRRADHMNIQLFETDCGDDFATLGSPAFSAHAANVATSRTLSVLRPILGPKYDLGRLFRNHLAQEFRHHDPEATMATMIDQPYVNHIPTLTGGYGHDMLKRFYKYHFIPSAARSGNRQTILVSETIGADTVVLEMVISFVHDEEHDYMLPGVKATGRTLKMPSVVVAKFRGDRLCHEHIYWDQASLLAQLGVLDPTGLPISGAEQAEKVLDPSLPSNEMMPAWARSEGRPI